MKTIKVIALSREMNGSDFHRVKYALGKVNNLEIEDKKIEVTFTDVSEDLFETIKNYDIFCFNWDCALTIQQIGILQASGVKIVYFLDDSFEIEDSHPTYNTSQMRSYVKNRVKAHLLNADCTVVTNERLFIQAKKYCDNIAVLPNFLDPNDFPIKEKSKNDKLRVGICGSGSHLNNFMSLKGVINKLAKNKQIAENCEFNLCGYSKTPKWDEVVKLFSIKKNLDIKVHDYKDMESYLELYENIDVLLIPLEYSDFNMCRSGLKLLECALTKTLPLGSVLYTFKELKGIVIANTPIQYEESLIKLLNKDYYNELLTTVTETNLKDNNYQLRFENTAKVINTVYSENLRVILPNIDIHTITYDENQIAEYKSYDNSHIKTKEQKSYLFEYNPLKELVPKCNDDDYFGVFSWKFSQKTGLTANILNKALKAKNYEEYDFINLSRRYWKSTADFLDFSYNQHPGLEKLLKKLLTHLGKEYKYSKDTYTYSNFYLLKSNLYKDYLNNWILPSIEFMENNPEYFEDAGYSTGLNSEELEKYTGMKHYTFQTFVLERLINFYIEDKQLKILNVL